MSLTNSDYESIRKFTLTELKKRRDKAQVQLNDLNDSIHMGIVESYSVDIRSHWDGEKSVRCNGKILPDVMRRAIVKFKKVNNRSDVQGAYYVYANIGKCCHLLPQRFYDKLEDI